MVNKAIENAQRKVEGRNFDIRKQLLEYDDVQRTAQGGLPATRRPDGYRRHLGETISNLRYDVVNGHRSIAGIPPQSLETVDVARADQKR